MVAFPDDEGPYELHVSTSVLIIIKIPFDFEEEIYMVLNFFDRRDQSLPVHICFYFFQCLFLYIRLYFTILNSLIYSCVYLTP